MKILALLCLLTMAAALVFSQTAREMIVGLSGSPVLRQHLAGRRLFVANFHASPSAKFDDYDGRENTAVQIADDAWLAMGSVEYHWQGSPRRERWRCAFDSRTRDVFAVEVSPTKEPTPDFMQKLRIAGFGGAKARDPSTAQAIEEKWGWKEP